MKNFLTYWLPIIVLGLILFAGFFVEPSDLPNHTLCLLKKLLYIDCPGCGMTRAFIHIPHGDFLKALNLNAASVVLYILFLIIFVTLIGRRFKQSFLNTPLMYTIRLYLAQLVLFLLIGHWIAKLYLFFSINSFSEYIQNLSANKSIWFLLF